MTYVKQMEIVCNPMLAAEFRLLIEATYFGTVKNYLRSPETEIDFAILLKEEYRLEQLAALCVEGNSTKCGQFRELFKSKAICFAVDGLPGVVDGVQKIHLDSIPDLKRCRVAYVPPAYLVQFERA